MGIKSMGPKVKACLIVLTKMNQIRGSSVAQLPKWVFELPNFYLLNISLLTTIAAAQTTLSFYL